MAEFDTTEAIRASIAAFDLNAIEKQEEQPADGFITDQRDLEDAVYGELPGTVVFDTREEFAEAHRLSERDRLFANLKYTEEGRAVLLQFEEDARAAEQALLRDDGSDFARHQKLVKEKNCTQYARDRYRSLFESVYQKPVLRVK